jgi:hypothetical protein
LGLALVIRSIIAGRKKSLMGDGKAGEEHKGIRKHKLVLVLELVLELVLVLVTEIGKGMEGRGGESRVTPRDSLVIDQELSHSRPRKLH